MLILSAPLLVQLFAGALLIVTAWLAINWMYQTIRKPTELFFPISGTLVKTPAETWRQYGSLFQEHSTAVITPELLAALAQVEGNGNPVARTYWRASMTWNPLAVYRPASSAVGMFQMTDPTFQEAKRYCIHNHAVVRDGPWYDTKSCWLNSLYTRVLPSHAIELAAAQLDRGVASAVAQRRGGATVQQKHNLAAVIHLCGATAGRAYAARGFRLTPGQRCGDHDVARYLARVNGMKQRFIRLAAGEKPTQLVAPH
ncbi:MAG TPA: lytic transglycosylase domain-containing protein [Nitrospiraceae bacterium]|nr:lytic transglycosylase domain-containing protein [Nitrospiraceae bacterium]